MKTLLSTFAAVLILPAAGAFAACGLDENGLMGSDSSLPDVTNGSEGGMIGPTVAEAAVTPTENSFE